MNGTVFVIACVVTAAMGFGYGTYLESENHPARQAFLETRVRQLLDRSATALAIVQGRLPQDGDTTDEEKLLLVGECLVGMLDEHTLVELDRELDDLTQRPDPDM